MAAPGPQQRLAAGHLTPHQRYDLEALEAYTAALAAFVANVRR
ncbi:hypothetical protein GCM10023263_03740 [Phytohabitans rumicis]